MPRKIELEQLQHQQERRALMRWGAVQGRIKLSDAVTAGAAVLAHDFYRAAAEAEFCGDPVETLKLPAWFPAREAWLPSNDLASLGFAAGDSINDLLVMTADVAAHVDAHGPVLFWVLHNQGLAFRQGRERHVTAPGEWFIFDDRLSHSVKAARGEAVYLGCAVQLESV